MRDLPYTAKHVRQRTEQLAEARIARAGESPDDAERERPETVIAGDSCTVSKMLAVHHAAARTPPASSSTRPQRQIPHNHVSPARLNAPAQPMNVVLQIGNVRRATSPWCASGSCLRAVEQLEQLATLHAIDREQEHSTLDLRTVVDRSLGGGLGLARRLPRTPSRALVQFSNPCAVSRSPANEIERQSQPTTDASISAFIDSRPGFAKAPIRSRCVIPVRTRAAATTGCRHSGQ